MQWRRWARWLRYYTGHTTKSWRGAVVDRRDCMQMLSHSRAMWAHKHTVVEKMTQMHLHVPYYLKSRLYICPFLRSGIFLLTPVIYPGGPRCKIRTRLGSAGTSATLYPFWPFCVFVRTWCQPRRRRLLMFWWNCLHNATQSREEKRSSASQLLPDHMTYVLMPYVTIFGTRRSCLFFKLFHYTLWFLTEPVMWPVSPAYQEPREMTQDMKVVNGKYMPKWNMTLAIRWCHTDRNWPLLPPLMPPQDRLERH